MALIRLHSSSLYNHPPPVQKGVVGSYSLPEPGSIVAVVINKGGGRRYRALEYDLRYRAYLQCERIGDRREQVPQYVEDYLLPFDPAGNSKIKPVFDLDGLPPMSDKDKDTFLARFKGHMSRTCNLGSGSYDEDWKISFTPYADRSSFHAVYDGGKYYDSGWHMGKHLADNHVSFSEYGIDSNIYRASGHCLRSLGSGKFGIAGTILRIYPEREIAEVSSDEFYGHLPTFVPEEYVRIVVDANPPRAALRAPLHENGTVEKALDVMRIYNTPAVRGSAFDEINACEISFDFENCKSCWKADHETDCVRGIVHQVNQTARLICTACDEEEWIGLDERSRQYVKQAKYLSFLHNHHLTRPDMPIYDDWGKRDLTAEEFFAVVRAEGRANNCPCRFCQGDSAVPIEICEFSRAGAADMLMDLGFFFFLREMDRDNLRPLAYYFNLFLQYSQSEDIYFLRTHHGIVPKKESALKSATAPILGQYLAIEVTYTKTKVPKRVETEKPFFNMWIRMSERRSFSSTSHGAFKITRNSPLNLIPAKGVDSALAVQAYLDAPEMTKYLMEWLWQTYKQVIIFGEPLDGGHRDACAAQLERYFLQLCFEVGELTKVALILYSTEGGVGKSTLPVLLSKIVGTENFIEPTDFKAWLSKEMGGHDVNRHIVSGDDVTIKAYLMEKLKARITKETVYSDVLYGARGTKSQNLANIIITTNVAPKAAVNAYGTERRLQVYKVLSVRNLEESGLFIRGCSVCGVAADDDGNIVYCDHVCNNHADFISMLYKTMEDPDSLLIFTGYLRTLYNELRPTWNGTIQSSLITTKATALMQTLNSSPVQRWLLHCTERGYHFSPSVYPTKIVPAPWYLEEEMTLRLEDNKAPLWESRVPVNALFRQFSNDMEQLGIRTNGLDVTAFMDELNCVSFEMRGIPISETKGECRPLQCIQINIQNGPMWQAATNSPNLNVRIVRMGDEPWEMRAAGNTTIQGRLTMRASSSLTNMSLSNPEDDENDLMNYRSPPREASPARPVGLTEEGRLRILDLEREGMGIADILRILQEDEDIRQNDHHNRMARLEEEDEVDEVEQDRRAQFEDDRVQKRPRTDFIDMEAESDSIEFSE